MKYFKISYSYNNGSVSDFPGNEIVPAETDEDAIRWLNDKYRKGVTRINMVEEVSSKVYDRENNFKKAYQRWNNLLK